MVVVCQNRNIKKKPKLLVDASPTSTMILPAATEAQYYDTLSTAWYPNKYAGTNNSRPLVYGYSDKYSTASNPRVTYGQGATIVYT